MVTRANAVVGEQLTLTMTFTDGQGNLYDPYAINRVEITDPDGNLLEEISGDNITHLSVGSYSVVTSSTWNNVPRTVYDNWWINPTQGASTTNITGSTIIAQITGVQSPEVYATYLDLRKANVGMDFSGYSDEDLKAICLFSKSVIDMYAGRAFGPGMFLENGQTTVDREGKVFIAVKNRPIAAVNSLIVYYSGSARVSLPVRYIDVFPTQGYMYFSTSHSPFNSVQGAAYPSVILSLSEKLFYQIQYVVTEDVPALIKYASMLISANLLKSNYILQQTGVSNIETGVHEFTNGQYTVQFSALESNDSAIITPAVRQVIDRFCKRNANVF